MIRVRRALLSMHDKAGLVDFARGLHGMGVEILSTGGTAQALKDAGIPVTTVASFTGSPEIFGGRVKTLHPKIHGGILYRRGHEGDEGEAKAQGVPAIDLVAVSLYPFEATLARTGATRDECVENIDIGGPAMIRSAAKNHAHVAVLTDPSDYVDVLSELRDAGGIAEVTAAKLAARAYARTAAYDAAIAAWLARDTGTEEKSTVISGSLSSPLRYGENPHQAAAAYTVAGERGGVLQARVLQGKELSYNNLVDLDAAWCLARDLRAPGVAVIKHANPCGAAEDPDPREALAAARATDPTSAYGGVYAFNRPVGRETAELLLDGFFIECVIAPDFDSAALALLQAKKSVRVLQGELPPRPRDGREWKRIAGGFLVQDWDDAVLEPSELRVASRREPTEAEMRALLFAWRVTKHVKSNAVVFCSERATLGIGAGQSSRVDSAEIAVMKAAKHGLSLKGSVVGSDAFFPFRDGIDVAARAGATAAIHPGGSVRDDEVIAAADEHGMSMLMTGRRHFRH